MITGEESLRELVYKFGTLHSEVSELQFIADNPEGFSLERILEGGNVNYIYKVTSKGGQQSVLLKYGTEQPMNEELKFMCISLVRQELEHNSLQLLNNLLPGCAPRPYCYDAELHIVAMEYLDGMSTLGSMLRSGNIDINLARRLGEIWGKIHYKSHRKVIPEEEWTEIKYTFRRCNIMKQFIRKFLFTDMFEEEYTSYSVPEQLSYLHKDFMTQLRAKSIPERAAFLYDQEDCFTHGDAHVNSVLSNGQVLKLIDLEFGGPGHPLTDLAVFLTFYLACGWEAHTSKTTDTEKDKWQETREAVKEFLARYFMEFGAELNVLGEKWVSDLVLLLGSQLFRMPLCPNLSHFVVINAVGCEMFYRKGFFLMIHHKEIKTTDQMVDILFSSES